MQVDETARSRDKILFHLKTKGPQTAAQIARRLGVTPMAVRLHLYALRDDGLVDHVDERGKVGRPARVWRLTDGAAGRFPDSHADLTVDIIEAVRATFGEAGLDRLITERTRRQIQAYSDQLRTSQSVAARVAALAARRREEGYMAEWSRQRDGTFLLVENHCPICTAARVCHGLCRDELELFRTVLGPDVQVERADHILAGARRCAYRVSPREEEAGGSSSTRARPRRGTAR